jgi:SAM-dependent methyltransferase
MSRVSGSAAAGSVAAGSVAGSKAPFGTPGSYETLPSEARPLGATQPDTLAVTAALAGLTTAPVADCRVLEIGCGVGGNLLPMAQSFPRATFVGIDLSPRQIAMANRVATGAGLKNIRFEVKDLTKLTAEFGTFDYVIAHGVFSWVSAGVRDKVLEAIKGVLAPQGVAYINYYVYPGWHGREMFRQMAAAYAQTAADPKGAAGIAREFVGLLAQHSQTSSESLYGAQVQQEAKFLASVPDEYLVHEYLEANPQGIYFQQFVQQLEKANLQFVGEVKPNPSRRRLMNELVTAYPELVADPLKVEQYVDFIQGSFVRRSLVCHAGKEASLLPRHEAVERLRIRAVALPTVTRGDTRSAEPIPFRLPDSQVVEVTDPYVKTVLIALSQCWPGTMGFEEILEVVRTQLRYGENFAVAGSPERDAMQQTIVNCYGISLLDLHVAPPVMVPAPLEKPFVTALARFQARDSKAVTNLLHNYVTRLSKTDRLILAHLNGARDRGALVSVIKAAISKGVLPDPAVNAAEASAEGLEINIEAAVETSLAKIAGEAFLTLPGESSPAR